MSASTDSAKAQILALLREGKLKSREIAEKVGVSPQVVWGIKSHWVLGKYGDHAPSKESVAVKSSEALKIVRSLSEGVDPFTGEVFPTDSPYQNPQVVRALYAAVRLLEQSEERQRRESRLPANAGRPWTQDEDKQLVERFDASTSINDLARQHNRTQGAIQARLHKLGKITLTFPPEQRA